MAQQGSPLKLGPSCAKRMKPSLVLEKCIICQKSSNETVVLFTNNSKSRFFAAVGKRKDDIYMNLISEYDSLSDIPNESLEMVYHKSCYKSYTSEHNIAVFTKRQNDALAGGSIQDSPVTSILTRSMSSPTNWSACIFCNKKSYKQDKKLFKIESDDRVTRITIAANHNGDLNLLHKINQDNFKQQAFYHNQCIVKYLKSSNKDIEVIGNSTSEYESINTTAFSKLISSINDDLLKNKKAFLLSSLIEKFVLYLPENMRTSFTTRKLQRYLENHYGDSVVIQSQQGQDSKPNDMATVYTAMKKCLDMSNEAGQDFAIQTFDQQLYAIAQQVKWSKPDIFNRHILRLGGFHSLSCFLASIGKLWADGGLRDLLVDSGVYAGNTAELMLNGKEFNRAVRGFTLVFEALQVLFISAFIHWCRTFDYFDQIPSAFWNVLLEFHTSICDQTDQAPEIKTRLEKLFEDHVQPLISKYQSVFIEFIVISACTNPTLSVQNLVVKLIFGN
ncbi:unnamed protein product [Mytilus edulis]|uniref:Uncharacterized protein n=1 Tax=Mytilus edulis TaxID=6550 RepID=A0A8S3VRQ8_MYTED|nr:unnamed protein product [Mytilus edulis]